MVHGREHRLHALPAVLQPVDLRVRTFHGRFNLLDGNVHVDGVGLAVHAEAAHGEFLDVDHTVAIHIQQLEEGVGVDDVEVKVGEEGLHVWTLHTLREGGLSELTTAVTVKFPEELLKHLHILPGSHELPALPDLAVLLRHLQRIGNEDASNDVRDGERHEEHKGDEQDAVPDTHFQKHVDHALEVRFSEKTQKECEHRHGQRFKVLSQGLHVGVSEICVLDVIPRGIREEDAEQPDYDK
mmetsp:Transcript_8427/g.23441  ORF Transcript_8427/g.23441 Transcript_8427/m.23441 type:complete len:240 (-) Transcript_8427:1393-2112(-)